MSRHIELKLDGTVWRMPVCYEAAKRISETVGDPLQMAIQAEQQIVKWSLEDVINILYVGMSEAGCSLPREKVAHRLLLSGLLNHLDTAGSYILALVSGGEVLQDTDEGDEKKT